MPYVVVCPKCGSKLKSGQPVAAGRRLACPQCKEVFTLSAPAPEVDNPDASPAPAVAAAAPQARPKPPVGILEPPAKPPARSAASARPSAARDDVRDAEFVDDDDRPMAKRSRNEDDEDDRPRSRRRDDDEDDDRPRSRRGRDADDDERPRSRRRRDDDEDEERPVSRRGRVDDDDDRPRSRRDPDEDEDDERPRGRKARVTARDDGDDDGDTRERRRRRNGRSKKNKRLLIGLIIGVAAFLFLGTVGAVLYFAGILGGGASSDMLAWAPADSQSIMYVDVEAADKVDELRNELKADALHMGKHGIKREDVSAVLGAGRISGMGGEPDVMVIKLRASADKNAIINSVGGTKATAGDKEYYKTRAGGALYFPSDRMVVISKNESAVTGRLGKDEGKVVITDDLRDVAKRGDGIVWIASTGQAAEQADFIGMISAIANMGAMFGPGGKGFGPGGPDFPKPSRAKSTAMSMKVSGNTASVRFESTYDNADAAQKIADDLRRSIDVIKSKGEPGTEASVSSSGATVTLRMSGPVKKGKGMMPFGM